MKGPALRPGGEDITWPNQVDPRGRKASSTRKRKPQTSNPFVVFFLPPPPALPLCALASGALCYGGPFPRCCPPPLLSVFHSDVRFCLSWLPPPPGMWPCGVLPPDALGLRPTVGSFLGAYLPPASSSGLLWSWPRLLWPLTLWRSFPCCASLPGGLQLCVVPP